ncbi:MAG: hypothetical protein DHS20C21_04830 [Gemmatimonadota bacterium]|nr:MAG: hypothetical protein DHS20C21_04830 [Gemmatimonadota bacterium]
MSGIERPGAGEHHEYFTLYTSKVPDGDVLGTLSTQAGAVKTAFASFGSSGSLHRYAPGKWSVREILGHLCDTERLFVYRGLTFARGDTTDLPGMEEDAWVAGARFDDVPLPDLLAEFDHVRSATLALFRTFDAEVLSRRGTANGSAMTVRSVPWIIAGHVAHHLGVLEERYRS